jgi:hypothetical protein
MTTRRIIAFASANTSVLVVFCVLYVWQFHMQGPLSDKIDRVVIPWGWLACFFVASFCTIPGMTLRSALKALGLSVVFSGLLFLASCVLLRTIFDPWM